MIDLATSEIVKCYHCGAPCNDDILHFEDKSFCCKGCETVYEILQESNLCSYYDFENNPGISLKGKDYGDKYTFLKNEEICKAILQFYSDDYCKITFYIPSIHCSSCIWLLENLYKLRDGIISSRINFIKKELSLGYNPAKISLQHIVELLATLGYEPDINLENFDQKKSKKTNKSIFIKLGVTGFCTGNIMALSFPEYFGLEHIWDQDFRTFVTYLNLILAQPVLFYGAAGYFKSAYSSLKEKIINLDVPISIGIFTIYARSLFETLAGLGPGYWDSFSGLVFLLLIGKWLQHRTYENLSFDRNFKSYFPLASTRIINNKSEAVPVTALEKGDKIEIRNQEIIPADSILISPIARIDYSFVTGESYPVAKKAGDLIYAGGRQVGAKIELLVEKPVSQSYLTQLWNHDSFSKNKEIPMTKLSADFSRYFTIITLTIALLTATYWYIFAPSVMWNAFTAVLIVACPCALSLAMPFTMENTMKILGRNGFYVKNPEVIQHMATISEIIFDKTGTLTNSKSSGLTYQGLVLNEYESILIKSLVVNSTHPLSQKIARYLYNVDAVKVENFEEIPGFGIQGNAGNDFVKMGSKKFLNIFGEDVSASQVYVSINDNIKGYFSILSEYREGIEEVINDLDKNFNLSLVSGDKEVDLPILKALFKDESRLNFSYKPIEKLNFIRQKQDVGAGVMMIGDGLNDAGALKQSNVGLVISDDVNAFFPACDVLGDAKNFRKIPEIIKFSKTSVNQVKLSFLLSLIYNFIAISMAAAGLLTPIFAAVFMPLSSISVVAFAVGLNKLSARIKGL